MVYCADICPEAQICPCSRSKNWTIFLGCSTLGQAKFRGGRHQQNCSYPKEHSISCNTGLLNRNPLHLDVESAYRLLFPLTDLRHFVRPPADRWCPLHDGQETAAEAYLRPCRSFVWLSNREQSR